MTVQVERVRGEVTPIARLPSVQLERARFERASVIFARLFDVQTDFSARNTIF